MGGRGLKRGLGGRNERGGGGADFFVALVVKTIWIIIGGRGSLVGHGGTYGSLMVEWRAGERRREV